MPESPLVAITGIGEEDFLAFVCAIARATGGQTFIKPQIAMMRTDGTGWQLVYDGGRGNSRFANFPVIAGLNTAHDIFLIDVAGTNLRRVTQEGAVQILPDWRRDTLLCMEMSERDRFIGLVLSDTLGISRDRIGSAPPRIWDGARAGKFIP